MRCDSCRHRTKGGHAEPCRHCVECGVPYTEEIPGELADHYEPELTGYEAEARAALERARQESGSSYNAGYLAGYADALKKVAQLSYYAISADGGKTHTWQWLSPAEVEQHKADGYIVTK